MTSTPSTEFFRPPEQLRAVMRGPEPVSGILCAGAVRTVWAPAEQFTQAGCWRAREDGHLLAPRALMCTETGTLVEVEHCVARLTAVAAAAAEHPGRIVTLAVSLLRAAVEATALGIDRGSWWLTEQGRPVLVPVGETPWHAEASELLRLLERHPTTTREVAWTRELLDDPVRLTREDVDCERALFAAAASEPIPVAERPDPSKEAPGRSREAPPRRRDVAVPSHAALRERAPARRGRTVPPVLAGTTISDRLRALARRLPHPASRSCRRKGAPEGHGHRAPLLLAVAVAATIAVGGALWPQEKGSPAEAGTGSGAMATTPSATSPASGAAEQVRARPSGDAPPDAVQAAPPEHSEPPTSAPARSMGQPVEASVAPLAAGERLLAALHGCGDSCAAYLEDPGRAVPEGVATGPAEARTLSLVDDYGGVAVLRAAPRQGTAGTAQIVVLVSEGGQTWRVRDVYDIADPH